MNYRDIITQNTEARKAANSLTLALKPFGLTPNQWIILNIVRDQDRVTISMLAKALNTSLAFMTTQVNVLGAHGFIRRDQDQYDARQKFITYTAGNLLDRIEKQLGNR